MMTYNVEIWFNHDRQGPGVVHAIAFLVIAETWKEARELAASIVQFQYGKAMRDCMEFQSLKQVA